MFAIGLIVTPFILPMLRFAGGFIRRLVFLPAILGARCDPEGFYLRLLALLATVAATIAGREMMYLVEFRPRPSIGVGVCIIIPFIPPFLDRSLADSEAAAAAAAPLDGGCFPDRSTPATMVGFGCQAPSPASLRSESIASCFPSFPIRSSADEMDSLSTSARKVWSKSSSVESVAMTHSYPLQAMCGGMVVAARVGWV
jgi:hypothetical protein